VTVSQEFFCPSGCLHKFVIFFATSPSFVRAAPVSFMHLHSLHSSIPFHCTLLVATLFASWHGPQGPHTKPCSVRTCHFAKASLQYSAEFHSHCTRSNSFQELSVHPLPIFVLASLACPGCGFVMVFGSPMPQAQQKHTPNPCVSLLVPIAVYGSLFTTGAGTRSQIRRASSFGFNGSLIASVPTSMRHGWVSFG
jgi:hypothetical protein